MPVVKAHARQEALGFLDSWLEFRSRQIDLPGFSVAVAQGGQIVFERAYGLADIERQEPLTTKHLFNVASQSKMFTAVSILQLATAGKLALDDPIGDSLPWLAAHSDGRMGEITIRQLLCHGAGLARDGQEADYWELERRFPDAAALRRLALATPLAVEPNTRLKYSNLGYALLGEVVRAVSGRPQAAHVRRIAAHLGLASTAGDYTAALADRMAAGHTPAFEGRRLVLRQRATTGAMAAAIGVCSTPADMCRFVATCFDSDNLLLGNGWQKEARRVQRSVTQGYDNGAAFGLGFELLPYADHQLVGHSGHLAGHTTATYLDPQSGFTVSVAANGKEAPIVPMAKGILQALGHFAEHATSPSPAHLVRLQGRLYSHLAIVQIVVAGSNVVAIDPDDWEPFTWPEELVYVSPTRLRVATSGSTFNEGELIHYSFARNRKTTIRLVRYGGIPLVPEGTYRSLLAQRLASANS